MSKYTFLNLAPDEFEALSKDILQIHLGMRLESFKSGPDQGIDLRGWEAKGTNIIVQCKRYTDYSDLIAELKREVLKVLRLNPDRYILTTSVPLSPSNKNQIQAIFGDYLHVSDIFGNSEINSLISDNPQIERKHYKLWLASTNILQSIVNNKVYVQSTKEQEHLERISKIYVMNDSYEEALELLKANRFVILSGNPGVGKSTLARVLAYEFIKNDFQLVVASNSVKEAFDVYSDGTSQVIFFDDFLGRNILDGRYPLNEEHQLITLIELVAKAKNKILILTTREYILNQAKQKYEVIKTSDIDISKCIVDVSKYTKFIKAKILYNHVFFSSLPEDYVNVIVSSKVYYRIVEHQNYSPRIIEAIIKKEDWKTKSVIDYPNTLLSYLNKPYSIWETAYESEIGDLSKLLLLVLVSTGTPVLKDDLYLALNAFTSKFQSKYGVLLNEFSFTNSLRELHDTFITTVMDSYGSVAIEFQNPSIYDFLIDYLSSRHYLQEDLISAAIFFNQLYSAFSSLEKVEGEKDLRFTKGRIAITGKLKTIFNAKLFSEFHQLSVSKIYRLSESGNKTSWSREKFGVYKKIDLLLTNLLHKDVEVFSFLEGEFKKNTIPTSFTGWEHDSYLNALTTFSTSIEINPTVLMVEFSKQIHWADQLKSFKTFKEIYPDNYDAFIIDRTDFKAVIKSVVENEHSSANGDNYSEIISDLETIEDDFSYDVSYELDDLRKRHETNEDDVDDAVLNSNFEASDLPVFDTENEEQAIDDLFQSLL
jgi:DNA polymerase III delta prime subunit